MTFTPLLSRQWFLRIFALTLILLLGACSSVRLGYFAADRVALNWLNRELDLSATQSQLIGEHLRELKQWHRRQALPVYVSWMQQWQQQLQDAPQADWFCGQYDQVRQHLRVATEQLVTPLASVLPNLTQAQLQRLRDRDREDDDEDEAAELIERVETWYGSLSATQRQWLRHKSAQPGLRWDARMERAWRAERQRRMDGMQRLAEQLRRTDSQVQREALSRRYLAQLWSQQNRDYVNQREQRLRRGCRLMAEFHAGTTPAQRAHLTQRIGDYAGQIRALY